MGIRHRRAGHADVLVTANRDLLAVDKDRRRAAIDVQSFRSQNAAMSTRTLTLRGLPDEVLDRLRCRAQANHRSLNGELLAILAAAATEETSSLVSAPSMVKEPAAHAYSPAKPGHPAIETIDKNALAAVCRSNHITWFGVFGSFARGEAGPDSDVDIVVEFAHGRTPGFGIVRLAEKLRPVFGGRSVDIVTRRGLPARLRDDILASTRVLYAAQ